jgi:pimeloyl-ACP methyl ester carboxylesterase
VPVFLGVGSNDITGPPHRIPSDLPNARDVTLFVLEGAGHTHNIHDDRARLWARLARWTHEVA